MLKKALAASGCLLLTAVAAGLALTQESAPSGRAAQPGTASHGREIYSNIGCATCHATTIQQEAGQDLMRAGHPLEGAAYRGTWWNGRITTDAGEASDFCFRTFIDPNSEGFAAEERKALVLFMQGLGSERGISPLVLLRRDAGDVDLGAGDSARGSLLYRAACLSCHADGAAAIRKLVGDLSPAQSAEVIRRGFRTMPFFQVDRLTSPQVADITAYLESFKPSGQRP